MNNPKKQHSTPIFYLKRWATSTDKKLTRFYFNNNRLLATRNAPAYTGYEDELYSFTGVPEGDSRYIEKNFMSPEVDNKAAPILDKLIKNEGLGYEEQAIWIRFVMSLRLRTPNFIKYLNKAGTDVIKEQIAHHEDKYPEDWVNKNFPGLVENFGKIVLPQLISKEHSSLPNAHKTHDIIEKLVWRTIEIKNLNDEFLTCDNPCILGTNSSFIILPLSPKIVFLAFPSEWIINNWLSNNSDNLIDICNNAIVMQAEKHVYATDKTLDKFIRDRWIKGRPSTINHAFGEITKI